MGNCLSTKDQQAIKNILTETKKHTSPQKVQEVPESTPVAPKTVPRDDWLQKLSDHSSEENKKAREAEIVPEKSPVKMQAEIQSNPMDDDILGGILKAMWPMISQHVHNTVLKEVEKSVAISLEYVRLIDLFRFTKSTLGTKYPKLKNFRLIDSSDKNVTIQVDVEYDGDCSFEMEIGTTFANIPLGIKDVKFKGVLRIELKDLIPTPPLISAIVAYFIQPPEMDFDLTRTANLADHPLIAKTVRKLVIDGVSGQIVNPHRIVVPLGVPDASIYRWPMPKYVAKVTVVEAHDLVNADGGYLSFISGKSDPYVKVYMDLENQDKTETISDNLNPVWNHSSYFRVYREDGDIQFNVFDEDVDADDDLGKVVVKLNEIGDDWQDWVSLEGIEHGKIKLAIQKYYPAGETKLKSDKDASRLVQFYVGELKGLFTDEDGYEKKTHQYMAKIVLNNGEEINFDQGLYEPKLKQTSAVWENAKHKFISVNDTIAGDLIVSVKRENGHEEEIGRVKFDLSSKNVEEISHRDPIKPGHSINARFTVQNFQ